MIKNISAAAVLLFLNIPMRFAIEWLPKIGLSFVSTALSGLGYLVLLVCLFQYISEKHYKASCRTHKNLLILYVVYTLYIIYDIIINPMLPRGDMMRTPPSDSSLIMDSVNLFLVMLVSIIYPSKVDFEKWTKYSCIFLTGMLILYAFRVDLSIYAYAIALTNSESESFSLDAYGAIDSLRLGWFCGINFICNLTLKNKWSHNKLVSQIIFWVISILSLSLCLATIQRGPVLFLFTTTLFYYFAKGSIRNKSYIVIPVLIVLVLASGVLNDILFSIAPELTERFLGTFDGGASGRFGSDDSAYSLAIKEISKNPLFGHYFRYTMTNGYFYGHYPHNIILECLMTTGIVFSIPMFIVFYRAVKNTNSAIKNDAPIAIVGLIYVYILSTLMTSTSLLLLDTFWSPLAVICCYIPMNNKLNRL